METCLLHNIIWAIFHVAILTSLVTAANSDLDSLNYIDNLDSSNNQTITWKNQSLSRVQSIQISKRPGLVENLPLLNGLFVGILCALATYAVLFYFQMWRPMVKEEEVEQRGSAEEVMEAVEVVGVKYMVKEDEEEEMKHRAPDEEMGFSRRDDDNGLKDEEGKGSCSVPKCM